MNKKTLSYLLTSIFFIILFFFIIIPLFSFFLTALIGKPGGLYVFLKSSSLKLTLKYYYNVLTKPYFKQSIYDTILLSVSVTFLSFILSLPISYALSRTTMPLKELIRVFLGLGISIPGFIVMYDLIIISTNVGLLPFSLYSYYGLVTVMTIASIPFMVMYVTLAFDNLDYRLIEASYANGVSKIKTFFRVTMPLLMPGFVSGWVIVFLLTTGTLSVPLLLAPPTFPIVTAYAYVQLFSFFNWGNATALLSILLLINMSVIIAYTFNQKKLGFAIIGGKGFHPKYNQNKVIIAVLLIYSLIIGLLPIIEVIILGLAAFSKFWVHTLVPSEYTLNNFKAAFQLYSFAPFSSLILSISAGFLAILISFISTYYTRMGLVKGKKLIDILTLIIFSLSPVMIGITYLSSFSNDITAFFINTLPIAVILGYTFGRIGYSTRALDISVSSISKSLFEAADIMGGSFNKFRNIVLPLIMPGIIEGFLLVFIRSMIDYGTTIMLAPYNWATLALGSYAFISTGEIPEGAALGLIILIINLPIMTYLYYRRGKTFHEALIV